MEKDDAPRKTRRGNRMSLPSASPILRKRDSNGRTVSMHWSSKVGEANRKWTGDLFPMKEMHRAGNNGFSCEKCSRSFKSIQARSAHSKVHKNI
jgi:hypothetical protein